jgi:hypothetical protein
MMIGNEVPKAAFPPAGIGTPNPPAQTQCRSVSAIFFSDKKVKNIFAVPI